MEYGDYIQDNVHVVTISGNFVGSEVFQFNQYLKPIMDEVIKHSQGGLIFDLNGVKTIDSVGIGLICGKMVTLKKYRRKFVLTHLDRNIYEKLALCELIKILTIYSTTMEALHYISTPTTIPDDDISIERTSSKNPSEKSMTNFMRPKNR